MCLFYRYVFPTADTATSRATSSQVGVTSPLNISLMGRKYNYILLNGGINFFNSASLICGMNRWTSGRVSASVYCGCWFDLQWWRSRCALLMSSNIVETAVQCFVWRCVPDFLVMVISNLIYQFLHSKLHIYMCVCIRGL